MERRLLDKQHCLLRGWTEGLRKFEDQRSYPREVSSASQELLAKIHTIFPDSVEPRAKMKV